MCVVCNLTNQGYETAYLAVQNESADTVIVPVVNRLLELHSYQTVSYTHLTLPTNREV